MWPATLYCLSNTPTAWAGCWHGGRVISARRRGPHRHRSSLAQDAAPSARAGQGPHGSGGRTPSHTRSLESGPTTCNAQCPGQELPKHRCPHATLPSPARSSCLCFPHVPTHMPTSSPSCVGTTHPGPTRSSTKNRECQATDNGQPGAVTSSMPLGGGGSHPALPWGPKRLSTTSLTPAAQELRGSGPPSVEWDKHPAYPRAHTRTDLVVQGRTLRQGVDSFPEGTGGACGEAETTWEAVAGPLAWDNLGEAGRPRPLSLSLNPAGRADPTRAGALELPTHQMSSLGAWELVG